MDSLFIANDVFKGCPIRLVYLGRNLSFDSFTFRENMNLEEVSLGEHVSILKDGFFKGCPNIVKIRCNSAIPPQIYVNTFDNYSAYLYVSEQNMKRYQKTNIWNRFKILPEFADNEIDGIYYIIDQANMQAYVTSGNKPYEGDMVIPSSVLFNGIEMEVTKISVGAFEGCNRLKRVVVPNSIRYIGGNVFDECSSLNQISLEDGISLLHIDCDFSDCPLKTVYLGRDLSYNHSPFAENKWIADVKIGYQVQSIGQNLMKNCDALKSVKIPDRVEVVESRAFYGCSKMDSLVLGKKVLRIGDEAFCNCVRLSSITSMALIPPVTSLNVFGYDTFLNARLYVIMGAKQAYKEADNWINFLHIFELGETIDYTLTMSTNEGGRIILGDDVVENETKQKLVQKGNLVKMKFVPTMGYRLKSVMVNGEDVTTEVLDGVYSLEVVADVSVVASFEKETLFLRIQQANNGCLDLSVEKGRSYLFIVHEEEGWRINSVFFNGEDVTTELDADNSYRTPAITGYSTLNVSFELVSPSMVEEDLSTDKLVVYSLDGAVLVDGAAVGECVKVYSVNGTQVAALMAAEGGVKVTVPHIGVYLVHVGGRTFKIRVL